MTFFSSLWSHFPGKNATEKVFSEADAMRVKFISGFSLVGSISLFLFSFAYLYKGNIALCLFEFFCAIAGLINAVLLRLTKNIGLASATMLLIMIAILNMLFITGGLYATGLYWFFTFPLLAFFLRGTKSALAWIGLLLVIMLNLWLLGYYGLLTIPFSNRVIEVFFITFTVTSTLIYIYQSVNESNNQTIRKQREELVVSNNTLSQQITERKTAESQLANMITQLNQQKNKLEESQKAMLSILEDLENARDGIEQARAKDRAMLASIGDGLFATDTSGRVILVNGAFEKMLGFSESEIVGKKFTDNVPLLNEHGKPVPLAQRILTKVLNDHSRSFSTVTHYYKRKDGSSFPVTVTVSPIMDGGDFIGAVEVFRDITKEREVDQAKTEFVSLASHQLRTPLSAINWFAEMLLDGDAGTLTNEQHQYIKEIDRSNKRMVELVNALLNVSRLELGTFAVEPEPTDIVDLAKSVVQEQQPQIHAHNLTLTEKYADSLPLLNVDPKLMRIILQNLVSNAVKYTPGGGKIEVNISQVEVEIALHKKNKNILIRVSDTGFGIPKHQQDKIFTKLFRADNVRTTDTEGTGLGLYIVKSIVEHSQGKIWFDSEENKGTTFYVSLPLKGMKKKIGTKKIS